MRKKEWFLFTFIFLLDIVSKYIAQETLVLHSPVEIIPGFFHITLAYNTGAAWGIFAGQMELFYVVTVAVAGFILYVLYHDNIESKFLRAVLVVMLAGTLGNFYDRVVFGYVRDFLDFTIFGYDYPIFNIADIALTLGFICFAIHIYRHPEDF